MAWRGLHIAEPARLRLKDGQIVVEQDDGAAQMPLEDIAYVVIDNARCSLTSNLLSAFAERGIALVVTDARHTPSGVLLPFHQSYRQAAVASLQINSTVPFKKRCWQAIIQAKIINQAAVLAALGKDEANALAAMAKLVGSGDSNNIEARAARDYWSRLFSGFLRDNSDDLRNKMLNYGYSITRSLIARALVAVGFLPCFGLHHCSQTNSFNLADDIIEPFRSVVDLFVVGLSADRASDDDLTVADRRALASLPLASVMMSESEMTLLNAAQACAASLLRAVETNSPALLTLPRMAVKP